MAFLISSALAAGASASFELLFVLDRGTDGPGTSTVKRFDPETGVYLGQFGDFSSSADSIAVDQSRNLAYVRDNGPVFRYNYNIGAFLGSFAVIGSIGQIATRPDADPYVPDGATDVPRYNPLAGGPAGFVFGITSGSQAW